MKIESRSVKNQTPVSKGHSLPVRTVFALTVTFAGLLLSGFPGVPSVEAATPPPVPLMTLLTPNDGAALNAESLRVSALVEAVTSAARASFIFDGQVRTGRHAGVLDHIEIAIDQQVVAQVSASPYRREFLLDERVALTNLPDGLHTLSLTAYQRQRGVTTKSTTFTLDRTLPLAPGNRVEAYATPAPFACFISTLPTMPRSASPHLRGQIVLGGQSDGIDLAHDRVVLTVGPQTVVLEPGKLLPDRRGETFRYMNPRDPLLKRLVIQRRGSNDFRFQIDAGRSWPRDSVVHLRIGNDWGGLNLATSERIARVRPMLDTAFAGQATIGAAGGTVQTTNAAGVVIRLFVPPGALTRDTLIAATPLAAPALAGQTTNLDFGVKFEPEGLVFAEAARLELDFGAGTRPLTDQDFIYLVTSPVSRLPLVNNGRVGSTILTASLSHFTTVAADGLAPLFGNLLDWDPRLKQTDATTFAELAVMAEAVRVQLALGCQPGPECAAVDAAFARLTAETSYSIATLLASCNVDVASPTRSAFNHYRTLVALAQALGDTSSEILECARKVLDALVDKVAVAGLANPSDVAVDDLDDLENQATGLAFSAVASKAHDKKHDVFAKVIDAAGTLAAGDPSLAKLQRMIDLRVRARRFGFADLQKSVLVQSVAAARTAISRLQQSCEANPTSTATEIAKELARTWVLFVNLDPTVAPTLSADFQQTVDACAGPGDVILTSARGDIRSSTYGRIFGIGEDEDVSHSLHGSAAPLTMSATTSKAQGTFLLTKQRTNTFTIDLNLSAGCGTQTDPNNPLNIQAYGSILRGGWTFGVTIKRAGTLRMELNPAWYGVGYCRSAASGFFDVRSTDNPNNVMSARVGANTQLIWTGEFDLRSTSDLCPGMAHEFMGRVFTLTFIPD